METLAKPGLSNTSRTSVLAPPGAGFQTQVAVEVGRPAETILDFADRYGVERIVLATHGRTGLGRWIFGSVAEKVLRAADRTIVPDHRATSRRCRLIQSAGATRGNRNGWENRTFTGSSRSGGQLADNLGNRAGSQQPPLWGGLQSSGRIHFPLSVGASPVEISRRLPRSTWCTGLSC